MFLAACLAFVVPAVVPAVAQTPAPQTSPQEQLAAKLASPFLQAAPWTTDYDAARVAARAQHKLILGYFTTVGP